MFWIAVQPAPAILELSASDVAEAGDEDDVAGVEHSLELQLSHCNLVNRQAAREPQFLIGYVFGFACLGLGHESNGNWLRATLTARRHGPRPVRGPIFLRARNEPTTPSLRHAQVNTLATHPYPRRMDTAVNGRSSPGFHSPISTGTRRTATRPDIACESRHAS